MGWVGGRGALLLAVAALSVACGGPPGPGPGPGDDVGGDGCPPSQVTDRPAGDCRDADGDGRPDGPVLDASGRAYCLTLERLGPGTPAPGDRVEVELTAYHEGGIDEVFIRRDADRLETEPRVTCEGAWCRATIALEQAYAGYTRLAAWIVAADRSYAGDASLDVAFECTRDACVSDPALERFVGWLRGEGYSACVVAHYQRVFEDVDALVGLRQAMTRVTKPERTVRVYDIVPTDADSTYRSLALGEAEPCVPSPQWTDYCPSPVPADYRFLQEHFRRTFGVGLTFEYEAVHVEYESEVGTPTLRGGVWMFDGRQAFRSRFPDHALVHYAIETLRGTPVGDMTGASHVAEVSYEPSSTFGAIVATHEWGHTLGLPHSFYGDGARVFYDLDGIMSNSYRPGTAMIDPLSPFERYLLEPDGGYADRGHAQRYSDGIAASGLLSTCASRELTFVEAAAAGGTCARPAFEVRLGDATVANTGFVAVTARDGCTGGTLLERRPLDLVCPLEDPVLRFTFAREILARGEVLFELDSGESVCVPVEECAGAPDCASLTACTDCARSGVCGWSLGAGRCLPGSDGGSDDGTSSGADWAYTPDAC